METAFKENSELKVISVQAGREEKIVPLSMQLQVVNGSDLYDSILYFSNFEKYKKSQLEGFDLKRIEELKKYLEGCELKITIKIELEKYE